MANESKKISELTELETLTGDEWFAVAKGNGNNKVGIEAVAGYVARQVEVEDLLSYGVEIDTAVSSPQLPRVGNLSLHRTLPVQSAMRGCLLGDDGQVVKYLDAEDWTGETRDGSLGQVMVELPRHWRKCAPTTGTKLEVRLSAFPLAGYVEVPKMYISAYEAAIDRSTAGTPKLASVRNMAADFRGGNNNAEWDGTYRTLLGRPATGTSRTNFRAYARNRNNSATAEWNCQAYEAYKAVYWFFAVEYATLDAQADYNAQPTAEGFRQGGLGDGVTTFNGTDWSNFNNNYPFVPCGHTDSLGNGTGVVAYTATNADGTVTYTFQVPRYRGIENPFGHLHKWTDGINIRISPDTGSGGDGLSKVFVCADPSKFSDTGYDGYTYVGDEARTNGYIKEEILGAGAEIIPKAVGGGSTTYFCDSHITNIPAAETLRGVLFGGYAINGAYAGLAFAYSNNAPSSTSANIGSRLCFIPETA